MNLFIITTDPAIRTLVIIAQKNGRISPIGIIKAKLMIATDFLPLKKAKASGNCNL